MSNTIPVRMQADLHMHSRYSDGSLWPAEIVKRAAVGTQALCLTDHDTMGGVPEFLEAAGKAGLIAWPGVEIDCLDPHIGYKSELLAYFPSGNYKATEALVSGYRFNRNRLIKVALERASAHFKKPELGVESFLEFRLAGRAGNSTDPESLRFSKTDVFNALMRSGALPPATEYREFRKTYFDTGLFADIKLPRPKIKEITKAVTEDGGVMVIPHLGHEFDDDPDCLASELPRLKRWLKRFRKLGICGVEIYKYRNSVSQALNDIIIREAEALGFFFTYGSDCHGPGSSKDSQGLFLGDFKGFPQPLGIYRKD
jgi:hypothetical protein